MSNYPQIEVKGKLYGYFQQPSGQYEVRSESNPTGKTPYLNAGSKRYNEVVAAIEAQLARQG